MRISEAIIKLDEIEQMAETLHISDNKEEDDFARSHIISMTTQLIWMLSEVQGQNERLKRNNEQNIQM